MDLEGTCSLTSIHKKMVMIRTTSTAYLWALFFNEKEVIFAEVKQATIYFE